MPTMVEQVTVITPDMSCAHCVATIESAIGALPGVFSIRADLPTKRVEIAFDPNRVSLPQIEAALEEEGYPVSK